MGILPGYLYTLNQNQIVAELSPKIITTTQTSEFIMVGTTEQIAVPQIEITQNPREYLISNNSYWPIAVRFGLKSTSPRPKVGLILGSKRVYEGSDSGGEESEITIVRCTDVMGLEFLGLASIADLPVGGSTCKATVVIRQ